MTASSPVDMSRQLVDCIGWHTSLGVRYGSQKREAPRAARASREASTRGLVRSRHRSRPRREVLYDRVTGRVQEVVILPGTSAPPSHRITLRLRPEQPARLDEVSRQIDRATDCTLPAAAIIRGVLDGVLNADVSLSECRSEADISSAIVARLAKPR